MRAGATKKSLNVAFSMAHRCGFTAISHKAHGESSRLTTQILSFIRVTGAYMIPAWLMDLAACILFTKKRFPLCKIIR